MRCNPAGGSRGWWRPGRHAVGQGLLSRQYERSTGNLGNLSRNHLFTFYWKCKTMPSTPNDSPSIYRWCMYIYKPFPVMGGTINHPQWLTIKRSYKRPISHGWCWRPLRRWHQHLDSSGGSVESRVALLAKGNQQRFTRCPCWVMGCKPNRKRFHQQVFFLHFFDFLKGCIMLYQLAKNQHFGWYLLPVVPAEVSKIGNL